MPSSTRQFATDAPVVRIWTPDESGVQRLLKWDQMANGYHVDFYDWAREDDAPSTRTMSGRVYPHVAGFRLKAVLSFSIYQPRMTPQRNRFAPQYGVTEADLEWLDYAFMVSQPIEFYLHGSAAPGAVDLYHKVEYRTTNSARSERMWRHDMTMEFTGLELRNSRERQL